MKPSPRDVRWLVDGLNDTKRRLKALENRKPGLAYSSIEDGAIREFDKDGVQGSQVGKQPDGTHGSVTLNGPKPPKPTDPIVTANPGQGEARWNGKFANGVVSPLDLKHVAAYFVLAGEFLDLSKQAGVMTGELGDNVQAQLEPGVYSVYLVSWSLAGRYSDAAGPVTMIVPATADTEWIQEALDDLDEKYDGVITEAGNLGTRLEQAETDLVASGQRLTQAELTLAPLPGKIAAAETKINTEIPVAIKAADDAAKMALLIAPVSTAAPVLADGSGRPIGAIWTRIDGSGNEIGYWRWTASGWVIQALSTTVIPNLSASKITSGQIDVARLNAQAVAAAVGTFLELNASQITAGEILTARLNAIEIAAATAAFQTVDVKNLFASTGTMSEAVITKLFTDVVMSRKITAQMIAVGDFTNACKNPGFEDGVLAPWVWTAVNVTLDTTNAQSGGYCAKVVSTGTAQGKLFTNGAAGSRVGHPDAVLGKRYRFAAFIKGASGGEKFLMQMYFYNAAGGYLGTSTSSYVATTGYVEYSTERDCPWADASYYLGAVTTNDGAAGTTLYVDYGGMREMLAGEMVIDGSLKSVKLDVDDLVANAGYIAKLTAKIVKSDMFVGKEFIGGVFTGGTFQTDILPNVGVKFDGQGFRAYGPNGGEPIVEMGATGVKAFGITDPDTGEQLITFDNEGGAAFQTLTVADTARIDGVFVTGGDPLTEGHLGGDDPGSAGPVLNGRSLFGSTFMNYVDEHPTVVDGNSWLTPLPHGPKVNAWRERTGTDYWDGIGGATHSRMMVTTTLNAVGNRAYLVTWQGPAIREVGTVGAGSLGAAVLRKSTPGGSVAAEQGTPIAGQRIYLPRGGQYFNPQGTTVLRCPEDIAEGKIMLGVDVYVNAGRQAESTTTSGSNLWSISVVDIGLRMSANDGVMVDLEKQGTATPTPPPAPAPNPVRQYTLTQNNAWHRSFNSNGTPYDFASLAGKAVQGLGTGATGGAKGAMIGFPSFSSFTAGANTVVTKVEVFLYAEHWYAGSGGTLNLGYHLAAARPGAFAETAASIKSQKMKRGQGLWITLPSSVHAAVKAGTFGGVTLRPPSNSTSSAYYGYINPSKAGMRARVRVTIRQ